MKKRNSNLYPFLTGILLGGVAIYLIKSEKGKEIIDLVLSQSESITKSIIDNSKELLNASEDAIETGIDISKDNMSALVDESNEATSNKFDEFDRGVQIAKDKIADAT